MAKTVAMRAPKVSSERDTPRQPGVAVLPPRADRTQLQPAIVAGRSGVEFAEDLATFAAAMTKQPAAVLNTLSPDLAVHAIRRANELHALKSTDRRAKIAATFAPRTDAVRRIRAVLAESGPLLKAEIYAQLPPWLRVDVADLVRSGPKTKVAPLVSKLAARLIRESTK